MSPSSPRIIFYNAEVSRFGHRVWLALEQINANYTVHPVDLFVPRPEWYTRNLSPTGLVPAIAFDVPEGCSPADLPASTIRMNESLPILEFLADALPAANLFPADIVARARVRAFISRFEAGFAKAFEAVLFRGEHPQALLDALAQYQDELVGVQRRFADEPTGSEGGFVFGEWSMAEIAAVPFLVRALMCLEHDIGKYPAGEGRKVWEEYASSEKFARMRKYMVDVSARPALKVTWKVEEQLPIWSQFPIFKRDSA
ncbi:thioredoxin-like protein [Epithele typhae]|uniref:thioredoxin-like protein n=1 Tax=Epithele typhae TaxID=378194 RepID=UPI0020082B25|nr:thioredoxin-like protein [Epithele typhae]KAH9917116.1 thioredoxin-like protein [Epithele typhae]